MNTKDFILRDNEVAILTDGTVIMNINCFKNNMISDSQLYDNCYDEDDYEESEYGERCCNIGDDYVEDYPEYYDDEICDNEYDEEYDDWDEDDYDENNKFPTMEYLLNLLSTPQGKLLMAIAKANERNSEDFDDFDDDDCD